MFKDRECDSSVTITLKKTATLYWIEMGQKRTREEKGERKKTSPSKMEMLSGDIMNTVTKYHS